MTEPRPGLPSSSTHVSYTSKLNAFYSVSRKKRVLLPIALLLAMMTNHVMAQNWLTDGIALADKEPSRYITLVDTGLSPECVQRKEKDVKLGDALNAVRKPMFTEPLCSRKYVDSAAKQLDVFARILAFQAETMKLCPAATVNPERLQIMKNAIEYLKTVPKKCKLAVTIVAPECTLDKANANFAEAKKILQNALPLGERIYKLYQNESKNRAEWKKYCSLKVEQAKINHSYDVFLRSHLSCIANIDTILQTGPAYDQSEAEYDEVLCSSYNNFKWRSLVTKCLASCK